MTLLKAMRKVILSAAVAAAATSGGSVLSAMPAGASTTYGVSGTVLSVSVAHRSFTIHAITHNAVFHVGGSYTIVTDSATRFVSATHGVAGFGEVRVGDVVATIVVDNQGTFTASYVAITPVPTSATTAHLPAGFPHGVPLPAGYHILSALAPSAGGHTSYVLALEVHGSVTGVTGAYLAQLRSAGFTIEGRRVVNGASVITAIDTAWLVGAAIKTPPPNEGVPAGDVLVSLNVEPVG
jgi:hypothetical protein